MTVKLSRTTRRWAVRCGFGLRASTLLVAAAALFCVSAAKAQYGGGPPGGGGGLPGSGSTSGGIMGGGPPMGNSLMGNMGRVPAPNIMTSRPVRNGLKLGLTGRWWDDGKTVKKIGLRSDQQRRMDDIFEVNKPTLLTLYNNLQREEARLISLPPGDLQDESKVFAAIDRVSAARTELEKENAHILLQIRQQMEPQQLAVLDKEIADAR